MMSFTSFINKIHHSCIDQLVITVEEGEEAEMRQEAQISGLTVTSSEETEDGIRLTIKE